MKIDRLGHNVAAETARHQRVFLTSLSLPYRMIRKLYLRWIKGGRIRNVFTHQPIVVRDPGKRFLKHALILGGALLVINSFAPLGFSDIGFTANSLEDGDFEGDFIDGNYGTEGAPLFIDEEGFVMKPSPVSEEVSRIGFTDKVSHKVVSGENLHTIAALYGLHAKTLMWENNVSDEDILRIGQTLVIPSVDGVNHLVASSDTLGSIAKNYGVPASLIKEHNNLTSEALAKGQRLFIPGGKRAIPEPTVTRGAGRSRTGSGSPAKTFVAKNYIASDDKPAEGAVFIFPTTGKVTQGFSKGHYGYDIANPAKPDAWAADAGTVVKVKTGCPPRGEETDRSCGGRYGNHVIIDHGDGLQTLYAHLEVVYVSEGQQVDQGQAIGMVGNTGYALGRTGIHLHFEVIKDGAKKNPRNYLQ